MTGDDLRLFRQYKALTPGEMASKLGISRSYLCNIEHYKEQEVFNILKKYEEAFEIPLFALVFIFQGIDKNVPEWAYHFLSQEMIRFMQWARDRKREMP